MGGSSLAATLVHHSGTIGPVKLKDTATAPFAECTYEGTAGTQYFSGMKVRAVRVEYPNLTSGVDSGKVGYKLELQHQKVGQAWQDYVTSNEVKITAYDNAWAKFAAKSQIWMGAVQGGSFRAEVILTWYNADNSVRGTGTWVIDNYTRDYNGSVGSSCKTRHSDVKP
jgi:hypothetical protein